MASLKSRSGKGNIFGTLKASPEVKAEALKKEAKKEESAPLFTIEAEKPTAPKPAAPAPTPTPSFTTPDPVVPKPAAAPAPVAAAVSTEDAGDNKGVIAVGAIVGVAALAAVAAGNQGEASVAPSTGGAPSFNPSAYSNEGEKVKAWISNYKSGNIKYRAP